MPKLSFVQAAKALGIDSLGGIGTKWCDLTPDGIMALMAHKSFFKKFKSETGILIKYIDPGSDNANQYTPAVQSLERLEQYFIPGQQILLIEAEFKTDGDADTSAKFDYATGKVFRATFEDFDRQQGKIVCHIYDKFSIY